MALVGLSTAACGDDASPLPPDAAVPVGGCDPLTNTGCGGGEKCSLRVLQEAPILVTEVSCVPNGNVVAGGTCGFSDPAAGGVDNCLATTFCLEGVCTDICADSPDTCPANESACTLFMGLFEEQALGMCTPLCDPLAASGCGVEESCYLRLTTGRATCTAAGPLGLGEACNAVNDCAPGLGCVLLAPDGAGSVCAVFCEPGSAQTATGETCPDVLGPDADKPTCVPINQFYRDTPAVPDRVGMCLDCALEAYSSLSICN